MAPALRGCPIPMPGETVRTTFAVSAAATLSRRRALLLATWMGGATLAGCSSAIPPHATDAGPAAGAIEIVSRDWHTEIGLSAGELHGPLAELLQTFPGATYLLFGFGERAYWTRPDPTPLDMLWALVPGPGVILVTGLRVPPAEAFGREDVVTLAVSRAGLERVSDFLWGELEKGADGLPHPIADGPYLGSLFYATRRVYSPLYTCNTWTAEATRIAGPAMSASGVLFASQVMARARAAVREDAFVPTASALR